jgi:hypothetical protein
MTLLLYGDVIYIMTERKILRRIFEPAKERDGTWRIITNYELNNLITDIYIINYIQTQKRS